MRLARMIQAVDAHAAGEPGRVIVGGVLDVPGATMLEKARHLETHGDALRRSMLREPRGYPAANCNLVLPPTHPDADAGFVIMEHVEYPGMSGTNTICTVTVLLDRKIEVRELGTVTVDVAWGGMFYVIADARAVGLALTPDEGRDIVRITEMIKAAAREQLPVTHPEHPEFTGPTIGQLSGPPSRADADMKNVVTVSTATLDWSRPSTWTGVIDRSPCGTGTCARMATLHARGRLGLHQDFRHEGILGTIFTGRLVAETTVGPYRAVVPTLSGQAWITGFASYVIDPGDPFPEGFTLGDIW